jgi:hypothetical protein
VTAGRFLLVLVEAAAFLGAALCLGEPVLTACERLAARAWGAAPPDRTPTVLRFGAVVLVGIGVTGYAGVALALAHVFTRASLATLFGVSVVAGRRILLRYVSAARDALGRASPPRAWAIACGVAVALFAIQYAAALAPPTVSDELEYHLPQALIVAHSHHLPLTLGGHYFYGNIPKLVEVIFAEAIAVSGGFELAHVLHLLVAGAFLLFAYGMVRRFVGAGAAILAVLFVLLYPEFTTNATSGLIDAASVSFEVSGLLALAAWAEERRPEDVARGATFLGLALSVKYTAAPTLGYGLAVFVLTSILAGVGLRRAARLLGAAATIVVSACGFWYAKNAARFGNPFYPLYFGHRGVSDAAYRALLQDIRQFGSRTVHGFLRLPDRYSGLENALVAGGLYASPFGLLVGRCRRFLAVLVVFVLLYSAYWYFVATHQTRFLMSAVVVACVVLAATLSAIRPTPARAAVAAVTLAGVAAANPGLTHGFSSRVSGAENQIVRPTALRYAVGIESRDVYLHDAFGCQFDAIRFLESRPSRGAVLDNWSQWHDPALTVYETHNRHVSLPSGVQGARRAGIEYVYLRISLKHAFAESADPIEAAYRGRRLGAENALLARSTRIWAEGDCRLYRVRTSLP